MSPEVLGPRSIQAVILLLELTMVVLHLFASPQTPMISKII